MLLPVVLASLCVGSFLNVVAYRLTHAIPFFLKRSCCPSCRAVIAWYDNIPLISWCVLRGRCRVCRVRISALYPLIEIISAIIFTTLFFTTFSGMSVVHLGMLGSLEQVEALLDFSWQHIGEFIAYGVACASLIVSIRTDLEALVIPQICSIWMVPLGVLASWFGFTSTNAWGSIAGAVGGYAVLWLIGSLFRLTTQQEGIGVGDMELLAMIGSFWGPVGLWATLAIGSITGFVIGGLYLMLTQQGRHTRIPFGPFLAFGALCFHFFSLQLMQFFLHQ